MLDCDWSSHLVQLRDALHPGEPLPRVLLALHLLLADDGLDVRQVGGDVDDPAVRAQVGQEGADDVLGSPVVGGEHLAALGRELLHLGPQVDLVVVDEDVEAAVLLHDEVPVSADLLLVSDVHLEEPGPVPHPGPQLQAQDDGVVVRHILPRRHEAGGRRNPLDYLPTDRISYTFRSAGHKSNLVHFVSKILVYVYNLK